LIINILNHTADESAATKIKKMSKVKDNVVESAAVPIEGFAGLKANLFNEMLSGFSVSLLAIPLSLGIAKASDFPPLMGLLTAIIGGMLVSLISGSRLTIKGPAAGLIVIVVGAVAEFGGGETGWHLACGAMVVSGIIQVLFGVFKLGKLTDIFPLSAVHGMLAAIGIIIIAKQIPVLLDINPAMTKGKEPLELLGEIPHFIMNLDPKATLVGLVCLSIMLIWQFIDHPIKKMPAPLAVLLFAIPAELMLDFQHTEPAYALVHIGNLLENIKVNVDFGGMAMVGTFIKFVVMFALVGSLESLLTVKAIDMMDKQRIKSDTNKDLIAVGLGNILSAILGGMPMISEVARSSANVNNGAKTRFANFFHGLFVLVFVVLGSHLIELIPNTALAAMLITVGIRLAHPKEFLHTLHIGKEQLLIFVVTIVFTLSTDLLIGIGAGMLTEIIINLINGKPLSVIFKTPVEVSFTEDKYLVKISKAAVFTNFMGIKRKLESIPPGFPVEIDLEDTLLVDHSVMENLHHFKHDYDANGGNVEIIGLDNHTGVSTHKLAAQKKKRELDPA
jgi:MFS superfamily sulfate permease-like transporter